MTSETMFPQSSSIRWLQKIAINAMSVSKTISPLARKVVVVPTSLKVIPTRL